ncbi:NAD-dependent epimerase [Balneolaceae bacterium ANBcel3]|nr:NAD-dependent epimerase [Balneolaceae bacterium ANBcel3]
MHILVTGAAGFIGFHLARRLINDGFRVTGLDNINDYYDIGLKYGRLAELGISKEVLRKNTITEADFLSEASGFRFHYVDIENKKDVDGLFEDSSPDVVVHLAAQAGVRNSLKNPYSYIDSNITGFLNILEACRAYPVRHLIYASSSSVYGANTTMPFSVRQNVDHPVSLYAASKKANELMAHSYSSLYNIPTTGLRFFTVYGPWGRPDMAPILFTKAILEKKPIKVFNHGNMQRDFTYIDDIIESLIRLIPVVPKANEGWNSDQPDPSCSYAPYRLFNIGANQPVELMDFISALEKELGDEAIKEFLPLQPGDVHKTWADVDSLYDEIGYRPKVTIKEGIGEFVKWYRRFYKK